MIPRASKIGGDAEGRDAGPVGMVGYVMTQSAKDVRAQLIDALVLDLVGPEVGNAAHAAYAEELLPIAPSKWYLTGFLIP